MCIECTADAEQAAAEERITDEMVEAGARALDPAAWDEALWRTGGRAGVVPECEGSVAARDDARGMSRAVLAAALGIDNDKETN